MLTEKQTLYLNQLIEVTEPAAAAEIVVDLLQCWLTHPENQTATPREIELVFTCVRNLADFLRATPDKVIKEAIERQLTIS